MRPHLRDIAGAMRTLRAVLSGSSLAFALALSTTGAHAQAVPGKEVAKRLFDEGVDLEKKGDYVTALAKLREAEQIKVTAGLLFHKGHCLEMMGKLIGAVDEYEAADKLARDTNKTEVHAAIIARLDPLRPRIPMMAIRLATPAKDAEVQLDGNPVAAPLLDGRAFRLDPGDHAVTARAPGYKNYVSRLQVPEAKTTTVNVTFDPLPSGAALIVPAVTPVRPASPAGAPPPATTTEPAQRRSLALPIAATAGTVVLAGTGIAFLLMAGSAQKDAQIDCLAKTSCDDARRKVRTLDAVALGSFMGAAGLGVLSVVLWTSKGDRTAAVVAKPAFAGGSVGLEGSF